MYKCENCMGANLEELNRISSENQKVPTSDGCYISDVEATRWLCGDCACVGIEFKPADRLLRFFSDDYDVSDAVQNNFVVIDGERLEKHQVIQKHMYDTLEPLLAEKGEYLEIACGRGELALQFATDHKDWACVGLDPSSSAELKSSQGNIEFIQDFFNPKHFENRQFDLVVAHGLVNRTPTLPQLLEMAKLCKTGAYISIEFVTLEQSHFAPFIWDHSFTYREETMCKYLETLNFKIMGKFECGSSRQFVCRFEGDSAALPATSADLDLRAITAHDIGKSQALHAERTLMWQKASDNFSTYTSAAKGKPVGLFGAGLFTSVLLHLTGTEKVNYIIDEVRFGTDFEGIPVIDLDSAKAIDDLVVPLCIRPRYTGYVLDKLKKSNISSQSILPE